MLFFWKNYKLPSVKVFMLWLFINKYFRAFGDIKFMNTNEVNNGSVANGISDINPKGNITGEQSNALVLRISFITTPNHVSIYSY